MKEKISGFSAAGTAILSSSCCILPLIAATFGFGIGGAAAFFEQLRPYLLTITFMLLGFSFYMTYFRKRKTECDSGACAVRGSSKTSRIVLWIVTVFVILITLFPAYSRFIF